jgi:hypothetical protein
MDAEFNAFVEKYVNPPSWEQPTRVAKVDLVTSLNEIAAGKLLVRGACRSNRRTRAVQSVPAGVRSKHGAGSETDESRGVSTERMADHLSCCLGQAEMS